MRSDVIGWRNKGLQVLSVPYLQPAASVVLNPILPEWQNFDN